MGDMPATADVSQLVAEHHQAVYRYAYRLSGSIPDAEDLTQQAFLVAQQKLRQLRSVEHARGWLLAILRTCFLKSCQKSRPVPAANLQWNIEAVPAETGDDQQIDQEQLHGALEELPVEFRVVLMMFYFEDCSYRQIAEELDLPIGTVMSRLSRAKGHLRSKLFAPASAVDRERQSSVTK
jgi:RNA polymerase sigma-70 factor (ECF subfamily)